MPGVASTLLKVSIGGQRGWRQARCLQAACSVAAGREHASGGAVVMSRGGCLQPRPKRLSARRVPTKMAYSAAAATAHQAATNRLRLAARMGALQAERGAHQAGWASGQGVMSGRCFPHSTTSLTIVGFQDCARYGRPSIGLGMQHGSESPRHVCQPLSACCVALAGLAACRRS